MGAQQWVYGLSIYFIGLLILITLMSPLLSAGQVTSNIRFNLPQNETLQPKISVFSWGDNFKTIFSFFIWNINIYDSSHAQLMQYMWIFRIIFVYIPLIALILCVWYSVPTVSG